MRCHHCQSLNLSSVGVSVSILLRWSATKTGHRWWQWESGKPIFDAAHLDKVFTRLTQKSDEDTFILWAPDTPRHSLSPMLLCQVDSTYSDIGIYTTASGSL